MRVLITWSEVGKTVPHNDDVFKRMMLLDRNGNAVKRSKYNSAKLRQWMDEHHIDKPVDLTQEFEKSVERKPTSTSKVGRFELGKLGVTE